MDSRSLDALELDFAVEAQCFDHQRMTAQMPNNATVLGNYARGTSLAYRSVLPKRIG